MIEYFYFLRKVPLIGSLGRFILKKYDAICFRRRKRCFLSCGNEVLQKAKNALDSENVLFWLDYGTLLGAYREHDFIKHDFDLDIGLWLKDAEIAKKAMLKNGFELIRCFQIKNDERRVEYCFAYKGVSIDLFFYELEGNFTLGHFFTSIIGISKLNYSNKCGVCEVRFPYTGFRQMLFKDSLYNVPAETDKYLSAHYGSTFMQLDPNFSESEASNIKYYSLEEKEGIAFIYRNI